VAVGLVADPADGDELRERAYPLGEAEGLRAGRPGAGQAPVEVAEPQSAGLPERVGGDGIQDGMGERGGVGCRPACCLGLREHEGRRCPGGPPGAGCGSGRLRVLAGQPRVAEQEAGLGDVQVELGLGEAEPAGLAARR
jgi:hypothetical protein